MTNAISQVLEEITDIRVNLECDDGFFVDMGLNWCHGRELDRLRSDFPQLSDALERVGETYGRPAMFTAFGQLERELFGAA